MIRRFLKWWRDGETMIGRDGVRINKAPTVTHNGSVYWNVRDILFYDPKKEENIWEDDGGK